MPLHFRMSLDTEFAGDKGWEHDFVFYVPPSNPEALVPISVGYNDEDWTYNIRQGSVLIFMLFFFVVFRKLLYILRHQLFI